MKFIMGCIVGLLLIIPAYAETKSQDLIYCEGLVDYFKDAYFVMDRELKQCEMDKITTFPEYNHIVETYAKYEGFDKDQYLYSLMCINLTVRNDVEATIENIYEYVQSNFNWTWGKRRPQINLRTMKGDCTDKAQILNELFRCNGIYSRLVHGYLDGRHDWVEVLYVDGNWAYWKPFEEGDKKIGNGVW